MYKQKSLSYRHCSSLLTKSQTPHFYIVLLWRHNRSMHPIRGRITETSWATHTTGFPTMHPAITRSEDWHFSVEEIGCSDQQELVEPWSWQRWLSGLCFWIFQKKNIFFLINSFISNCSMFKCIQFQVYTYKISRLDML